MDFYMSHTIEKRKLLAFQWCITQENPIGNDDFRLCSYIWEQSTILYISAGSNLNCELAVQRLMVKELYS